MKILYWTPLFWPDIGGIEVLAMRTLPALMERGLQFLVITSHGRVSQPDLTEYKGIPIQRFPFWTALAKNDVLLILQIQKQVAELKRAFKPDLIHINFSGYTALFQIAAASIQPARTLIALHNDPAGLITGPDTCLEKLFHLADWVTAISRSTLASACQVISGIADRSSVIYGCSGEANLSPTPLSFAHPCILGIGRLSREKGFDLLLDAFSLIAGSHPDVFLRIIGDGPERVSLEQQVIRLGLEDRVELMGNISNDDIPKWINQASLVVVSSRRPETFGLVAVEAAWMARPVVAAKVGGLVEIVVDHETGCLVEQENPAALADAILFLLSRPEKAQKMGQAGRLRVQKEFSLAKYVDSYASLYQQMLTDQIPGTGDSTHAHAA